MTRQHPRSTRTCTLVPSLTPFRTLEREIGRLPTSPKFPQWQRDIFLSPPRYLRNMAHYGLWQESADLDEATAILGERPSDVKDADRRMKAHVQQAGPEENESLIRYFHRQIMRDRTSVV